MELCIRYKVPVVITSLGARVDINEAIHIYGGLVFHDVIDNAFARKATKRAPMASSRWPRVPGGYAGTLSPFALIQEISKWFDGPVALSGSIGSGGAIAAARVLGAELGCIGSAFIVTEEVVAPPAYKQMIVFSHAKDIVYSDLFTGVHGNYLAPGIAAAGLDLSALGTSDSSKMNFAGLAEGIKAWRDIYGCGQGIGAIHEVVSVARLDTEYRTAPSRWAA